MSFGPMNLNLSDVIEGVPEMIHQVQAKARFLDGVKFITVRHRPV